MPDSDIARIQVRGLHQQFDVELRLRHGLNVLYGKNGKGKTTLLHVLANFKELDFFRFKFLLFREIEISTFGGDSYTITRSGSGDETNISAYLNGGRIGGYGQFPSFQQGDRAALQARVGGRPVYLPAFRAILERVRSDAYTATPGRDAEFERIREEERVVAREAEASGIRQLGAMWSGRYDASSMTARKTVQCREWFGSFVPIVRYPSILEVTERLSNEFRDAQLETGQHEQRMLSEMFVEVFKALMANDQPSVTEVEDLVSRVQNALAASEGSAEEELFTDSIGTRLAEAMSLERRGGTQHLGESERRVLRLYAQMLERRNDERKRAFAKVRQFEDAVNKFLDEKALHISDDRVAGRRIPGGGVYIQTSSHRTYGLGPLSSGERQVLTMLFSATRMSAATGMFLIDEPELSLHIDWQRIILGELMAQAGGRQIVACTHSPEVGADHMDALQLFSPAHSEEVLPSQPTEGPDSVLDDSL